MVRELEDAGALLVKPAQELETHILVSGPALCTVDPGIKAVVAGADWNLTHRKVRLVAAESWSVLIVLDYCGRVVVGLDST